MKATDGIVTVMKAGGQYQVVIGNHVPDVYDVVCQIGKFQGNAKGYPTTWFGLPVFFPTSGYPSSVVPIVLAVVVGVYVERFFKKMIPSFVIKLFIINL